MRGARLRMGDESMQHSLLTPESLNALIKFLKEEWEARGEDEREPLEEVACFVMTSYAGGFSVEEFMSIYLG